MNHKHELNRAKKALGIKGETKPGDLLLRFSSLKEKQQQEVNRQMEYGTSKEPLKDNKKTNGIKRSETTRTESAKR